MNKLFSITLLGICVIVFGCTRSKAKQIKSQPMIKDVKQYQSQSNTPEKTDLKSQLDATRSAFNAKAEDTLKKTFEDGVKVVAESGVTQNAKQIGDTAPNFILTNALDEKVELSTLLKEGPVVLTWYRGGWCPYCNITLNALQEELPQFTAAGATLIALTPELPDSSMTTKEKLDLKFHILSDINSTVAKAYGVQYQLTEDVSNIFNKGVNLKAYNGDDGKELPLAATYIIEQDGTISYAFLDADYRNRAEPSDNGKTSKGFVNAPAFIILYGDKRVRKYGPPTRIGNDDWWKFTFEASLNNAFMSMQYAATSLGLGSMWVSAFRDPEVADTVQELLNIPSHFQVYEMLALGQPDIKITKKKLRDVSDVLHYNMADNYRSDEEVEQYFLPKKKS